MALLTELIKFIIGNISLILGLTQGINAQTAHTAQESTPNLIQDNTHNAILDLDNITYGLFALHNQLTAIKAVVDTLQVATNPVVLPVDPPPAWISSIGSQAGNTVWTEPVSPDTTAPYTYLRSLGTRSLFQDGFSNIFNMDQTFSAFFPNYDQFGAWIAGEPTFDPGAITESNDFVEELQSQNGAYTVAWYNGVNGFVELNGPLPGPTGNFITNISGEDYERLKRRLFPVGVTGISPIWPGIANVLLGSSVPLDRTVTLTEPMDGIIITLDSVPPAKPTYVLGTMAGTAHIGQIAFVADNGSAEYPQNLSFASEIYVCQTMSHAASAIVRTIQGVTGSVQAWTIAL